MAGMIEGYTNLVQNDIRYAAQRSAVSVGANAERILLAIKNSAVFPPSFGGTTTNQVMIYPDELTVYNGSTAFAIIRVYLNVTSTASYAGTENEVGANSVVLYDTGIGTTITTPPPGKTLFTFYVGPSNSIVVDLSNQKLSMVPGDTLTVTSLSTSASTTSAASLGVGRTILRIICMIFFILFFIMQAFDIQASALLRRTLFLMKLYMLNQLQLFRFSFLMLLILIM